MGEGGGRATLSGIQDWVAIRYGDNFTPAGEVVQNPCGRKRSAGPGGIFEGCLLHGLTAVSIGRKEAAKLGSVRLSNSIRPKCVLIILPVFSIPTGVFGGGT